MPTLIRPSDNNSSASIDGSKKGTDSGSGYQNSRMPYWSCSAPVLAIELNKRRWIHYHPSKPVASQFNPMGASANTLGSRALTSPSWRTDGRSSKSEDDVQHVKLPVLQLCVGWPPSPPSPPSPLRTGVAEAMTPLAKAMAARKEKRVLKKSIVKSVWMRCNTEGSLCVRER